MSSTSTCSFWTQNWKDPMQTESPKAPGRSMSTSVGLLSAKDTKHLEESALSVRRESSLREETSFLACESLSGTWREICKGGKSFPMDASAQRGRGGSAKETFPTSCLSPPHSCWSSRFVSLRKNRMPTASGVTVLVTGSHYKAGTIHLLQPTLSVAENSHQTRVTNEWTRRGGMENRGRGEMSEGFEFDVAGKAKSPSVPEMGNDTVDPSNGHGAELGSVCHGCQLILQFISGLWDSILCRFSPGYSTKYSFQSLRSCPPFPNFWMSTSLECNTHTHTKQLLNISVQRFFFSNLQFCKFQLPPWHFHLDVSYHIKLTICKMKSFILY